MGTTHSKGQQVRLEPPAQHPKDKAFAHGVLQTELPLELIWIILNNRTAVYGKNNPNMLSV